MRPMLNRIPSEEPKVTVSYSLPVAVRDAVEDKAYANRTNKSHEAARLIRLGLTAEDTTDDAAPTVDETEVA